MLRARGIGNYGDYYTPEGFVPGSKENTNTLWMVIYPLAKGFSYDSDPAHYKGAAWIVSNLVDTVVMGGSFHVGVGRMRPENFIPLGRAVEGCRSPVESEWGRHLCYPPTWRIPLGRRKRYSFFGARETWALPQIWCRSGAQGRERENSGAK